LGLLDVERLRLRRTDYSTMMSHTDRVKTASSLQGIGRE